MTLVWEETQNFQCCKLYLSLARLLGDLTPVLVTGVESGDFGHLKPLCSILEDTRGSGDNT